MVGRGTRLDIPTGKLMFRVYDYTNATRLFGEEFKTRPARPRTLKEEPGDEEREPVVQVEGLDVRVMRAGRMMLTQVDGRAMPVPVEVYKEMLAERLLKEAPTPEALRRLWIDAVAREGLLVALPDGGHSALVIRVLERMDDCDLYGRAGRVGLRFATAHARRPCRGVHLQTCGLVEHDAGEDRCRTKALTNLFARGGTEAHLLAV